MSEEEHWYVKELKTEIERLAKAFNGIQDSLREKIRKLTDLDVMVKEQAVEIERLKQLITELADALQIFGEAWVLKPDLIKRAREAAKHE